MPPRALAAPLVALLACACAELYRDDTALRIFQNGRGLRAMGDMQIPPGCLYDDRWFMFGATVHTREPCLQCVCASGGALACTRRACAALPNPPPRRCHMLHRKGACCPELHCPEGVTMMEHSASARFENEDDFDVAMPASITHACVEGGTLYAAGSAMGSNTACEQCFCLGGARRCVRPRCLPPPAGCSARPSPGACCPSRYYCDHLTTRPPDQTHPHDCRVEGKWISEGERVVAAEKTTNCTQCFCLRGSVRCQPLACALPLLGCQPLLRPGQCCPHQYHCEHQRKGSAPHHLSPISDNSLTSTKNDDRSFHTSKSSTQESTTKAVSSTPTTKKAPSVPSTKKQPISTTKVKRKTNDPPPTTASHKPIENITKTIATLTTQKLTTKAAKSIATTVVTSTVEDLSEITTEQPEGSVKIMVNGTINCTAELSSTSLPLNITVNDTDRTPSDVQSRVPFISASIEAHTTNPNDIITDRNVNGEFDENDSFIINVTSSLRTNTSHSTSAPVLTTVSKVILSSDIADALNISKKTKEDYDYDYIEPTLPPSLPNLKIIPFVAADAVLDDDKEETIPFPLSDRENKFPVYYPSVQAKEALFANRREDVLPPTQYPVFVSDKTESSHYPTLTHEVDVPKISYPGVNDLTASLHEYTVSTSLGSRAPELKKPVTKPPSKTSTFSLQTPSVNLFSPPVETEGGFIPKGPGIHDEYYAVYPSTQVPPSLPHLTTSMQLDTGKDGECISGDGRHVPEGDTIPIACSMCTCAWGELHCSPRPCHTPPGCIRRLASSSGVDLCCGELVCDRENKTTPSPILSTRKTQITLNESKVPIEIQSEILPFDPPADRSVPVTNKTVEQSHVNVNNSIKQKESTHENNIEKYNTTGATNLTVKSEVTSETPLTSSMSTEKSSTITTTMTTSSIIPETSETSNDTNNQSIEYEDEEEEEFSFGSVLKLLLSDSYDKTTSSPYKKKTMPTTTKIPTTTTPKPISTTKRLLPRPTLVPFVSVPHHPPYVPPKKVLPQNTVNRIDHLVLGEATAIKKPTPRPITTPYRPISSFKPYIRSSTIKAVTTKQEVVKKEEQTDQYTSVTHEGPRSPSPGALPGIGGLLKLAGCNIYGRMYRVGRIIAELSTPCQECRCTELGVQCRSLNC